jgi:2-acylglycerol O-acyltransferase 2
LLLLGYTFGECDAYNNLQLGASARMWMLKSLGFVLPVFWGDTWWCPLLPRATVKIDTVLGNPLQLPCIAEPTDEEVAKYHALYIQSLTELFDRHKERFGYGGRQLEVV